MSLQNKTVVITRAKHQAAALAHAVTEAGGQAIHCPVIEIVDPPDLTPLKQALKQVQRYDWIVFTSANAAERFLHWKPRLNRDTQIAAVGPKTAAALESLGLKISLVAATGLAEDLVSAFQSELLRGPRILFPRALKAREVLPAALESMGAIVDVVPIYQTDPAPTAAEQVPQVMAAKPDWVTFLSASTVQRFVQISGAAALRDTKIASIGPITNQALEEVSLKPTVVAANTSAEAMAEAILAFES
jgi:uroporphyrinogen-III synthase